MVYQGTIHNGVVIFKNGVHLPEGATVRVELAHTAAEKDTTNTDLSELDPIFRMSELAIDTGIPDLGVNIDHYLYGHPKAKDVSSLFLDTNGWLPLLNATEYLHATANESWADLGRLGYRVVLTDWIIAETGNGLARSRQKLRFADAITRFWESPLVEIVIVDQGLIKRAVDLYCEFTDKSWGLVDCASFVVMHDLGITEAFTSDQHFEQAGFKRLLVV